MIRALLRNREGLLGLVILLSICIIASLASFIAPYDPVKMHIDEKFAIPSGEHLLGTDSYGRDILSRIIYGFGTSLFIAVLSISFSTAIGGSLGITSGYFGGKLDTFIMRMMDMAFAFPVLLLAITIAVILGQGAISTILAIGIVYTPTFARIARGSTLTVREEEFVEAARALGESDLRILTKHIVPHVTAPIVVQITLSLALAIIFESALSFLGLGTRPPMPSLGLMISNGIEYLELSPWETLFPGVGLALLVVSFNLIGEAFQQAMDPRLRRRRGA